MEESLHQGRGNIRRLLDSFQITDPYGKHLTLVFGPAQMSLRDLRLAFLPGGFDKESVRGAIIELLKALDFLHSHVCQLPGFLTRPFADRLQMCTPETCSWRVESNDLFRKLEEREFSSSVPRKLISPTRTIYLSRLALPKEGPSLLSDFGEARIGPGPHGADNMPWEYRAMWRDVIPLICGVLVSLYVFI